jgi:hypothetical protein
MLRSKDLTEDRVLLRVFSHDDETMTPSDARAALRLRFSDADKRYMNRLAQRARDGVLTDAEMKHVETYSRIGSLIGILHAKARTALGKPASTKPARSK